MCKDINLYTLCPFLGVYNYFVQQNQNPEMFHKLTNSLLKNWRKINMTHGPIVSMVNHNYRFKINWDKTTQVKKVTTAV